MVAAVVGLETVELIDYSTARPRVTPLVPPESSTPCKRFPVALAAGDVDGDGISDVGVMDASCGNWIAFGGQDGTFSAVHWGAALPMVPPQPYLYVEDWDRNGLDDEVVLVGSRSFGLIGWADNERVQTEVVIPEPRLNHMLTTRLAIPVHDARGLGAAGAVIQRNGVLTYLLFDAAARWSLIEAEDWVQKPGEGYLAPFVGYDHFTPLEFPECDIFAIGIGLFPSEAGAVPRRVQLLKKSAGPEYEAMELESDLDVVTVSVLALPENGEAILGVFGFDRNGTYWLQVWHLVGCGEFTMLSAASIEFSWQTIRARGGSGSRLPKRKGVKIIADAPQPNSARFAFYDGFTIWIFTAAAESDWRVEQSQVSMHEER